MYHSVSKKESESLTVFYDELEKQFNWISKTYHSISSKELDNVSQIVKPLLITFDDGFTDFKEFVEPLLIKYNLKATLFIPFAYIGKQNDWDNNSIKKLMNLEELKTLDSNFIELGWHSYSHKNYQNLTEIALEKDLLKCENFLKKSDLNISNILAYPYGGFPRSNEKFESLSKLLNKYGIKYAFRIGNRLNKIPLRNKYQLQRIDIKGTDSFRTFKKKTKHGKLYKWFIF